MYETIWPKNIEQIQPRLKRYFEPRSGKSAASKEALVMFKDKNQRPLQQTQTSHLAW